MKHVIPQIWEPGYKLVRHMNHKGWWSINSPNPRPYAVGKITTRFSSDGPLTVFQYIHDAQNFLASLWSIDPKLATETELFTCAWLPTTNFEPPLANELHGGPLWAVWSCTNKDHTVLYRMPSELPWGTDYADQIMLLSQRTVFDGTLAGHRWLDHTSVS